MHQHAQKQPRNAAWPRLIQEYPLTSSTFADLGVHPAICDALSAAGINEPFPIQSMCIPLALEGNDLIGQAKTGTGKTLGFGIPLLQRLNAPGELENSAEAKGAAPQALVVVPTRELCVQVAKDLELAGSQRGIRVLSVYGGRSYEPQVEALVRGIEVVVGTPGRLLDLARQGKLRLNEVKVLVLDEADEMLDMGFLPDVESIVSQVPANRQTLLFSATMPGQIVNLARRYMTSPTHIRASDPNDDNITVDAIEQHIWRAHAMDKPEIIARVLQAKDRGLVIVFCRTKRTTQKLADDLTDRGFAVGSVHGDLGQGAREQALRAFRNGKIDVLVATDVAARGIDVEGVTHVINYACPEDEKMYLHRIGRTGRAGASGVAVTLVDWDDVPRWLLINKALGLAFTDPVETYSTSAHIFTGLGIPTTATGRLPRSSRTREGLGAEQVEDLGETGASAGRRSSTNDGARSRDGQGRSSSRSGGSRSGGSRSGGSGNSGPKRDRKRTRGGSNQMTAEQASGPKAAQPATGNGPATEGSDKPKRKRNRRRRSSGGGGTGSGNATGQPAKDTATS
ncbi:MAG: DEAD/DEAH box helicase [Candidatus Nanopelagicales bacterium]